MEDIISFLQAQQAAEEAGEVEFTCPICGAVAVWARSEYNNHLHCGCIGCGFLMME